MPFHFLDELSAEVIGGLFRRVVLRFYSTQFAFRLRDAVFKVVGYGEFVPFVNLVVVFRVEKRKNFRIRFRRELFYRHTVISVVETEEFFRTRPTERLSVYNRVIALPR